MSARPPVDALTHTHGQRGFTLIEALVASAIFTAVALTFIARGTAAMVTAEEVRNWRIARDIAETYLSELKAGAREMEPERGRRYTLEAYQDFEYEIVVGEAEIEDLRTRLAEQDQRVGAEGSTGASDRLAWQRERDQLRRAQTSGMSLIEYQDNLRERELEERVPSEDEFEDVAIVVYFPRARALDDPDLPPIETFMLRAKVSTMAIAGLTPEQVQKEYADQLGTSGTGGDPGSAGASGLPGGTK
ncbi:MAG: prepilin-type N-terminal cleavage/methylation domain-containing protein [Planctomycetes bacterium]|nr:prepilin-type N-terminal cleavage/methylation domain-containing protein [Planctomycetota bacterium]